MKFSLDLFMIMNHNLCFADSNDMLKLISLFDIKPNSIVLKEHQYIGARTTKYKEIYCTFGDEKKDLYIQAREGTDGILKIESVDFMYAGSFWSISDSELEYKVCCYDYEAIKYIQGENVEPHAVSEFLYRGIEPDDCLTINKHELANKVLKENYTVHEFIYKHFSVNQRKRRKEQDGELPFSI